MGNNTYLVKFLMNHSRSSYGSGSNITDSTKWLINTVKVKRFGSKVQSSTSYGIALL